jgi:hypothetical protein
MNPFCKINSHARRSWMRLSVSFCSEIENFVRFRSARCAYSIWGASKRLTVVPFRGPGAADASAWRRRGLEGVCQASMNRFLPFNAGLGRLATPFPELAWARRFMTHSRVSHHSFMAHFDMVKRAQEDPNDGTQKHRNRKHGYRAECSESCNPASKHLRDQRRHRGGHSRNDPGDRELQSSG